MVAQSLWESEIVDDHHFEHVTYEAPHFQSEPEQQAAPTQQAEAEQPVAPEQHFEPMPHFTQHVEPEQHFEPAQHFEAEPQAAPEPQPEAQASEPLTEAPTETANAPSIDSEVLALSVDDFSALEERVLRTVNLVKQERQARAAAEERAARAELVLSEQLPVTERLETEVKVLRTERDHVRQRVERLLAQLDALEL